MEGFKVSGVYLGSGPVKLADMYKFLRMSWGINVPRTWWRCFILMGEGKILAGDGGKKADDAVGWRCEEMAFWELCLSASWRGRGKKKLREKQREKNLSMGDWSR